MTASWKRRSRILSIERPDMNHIAPDGQLRNAPAVTPVTLEVVKGALRSAQSEMERLLQRTAMSPVIREKQDYFCGLFDRDGRLLIGTKLPILGNILAPILEEFPIETMREGDVYWYDDPYLSKGGVSSPIPGRTFSTSAACAPARRRRTQRKSSTRASSSRR
jgi:hypothetical protein